MAIPIWLNIIKMIIIAGLKYQEHSRYLTRYKPNVNLLILTRCIVFLLTTQFMGGVNVVVDSGNRNTIDSVSAMYGNTKNIPNNYIKWIHQRSRHEGEAWWVLHGHHN